MRPSDGATTSIVAFPLDRVWAALPAVFDSLGIPISSVDATRRVLGNSGWKVRGRLGKVSLSQFLECGSTQGFPSADTYEIHLSVLTHVEAAEAGVTTVSTLVEASGRPMAIKGEYIRCSTKGELESRIAAGLKRRLQG